MDRTKPVYIQQAARILDCDVDQLPVELEVLLEDVADSCRELGGELRSRQIVSLAVSFYKSLNKGKIIIE